MGVETEIKWKPGLINKCVDCTMSGCPIRKITARQHVSLVEFISGNKSLNATFRRINKEISNVGASSRSGPIYSKTEENRQEQVSTNVRCPERLCPVGSRRADIISNLRRT